MRLAQGKVDAAEAAIRRLEAEVMEPSKRAGLLPAYIEIMLAVDDQDAAREACAELESLAQRQESAALAAMAAQARGATELAAADPRAALGALRRACEGWQQLEAPYESARVRELLGLACRELGDNEAAGMELEAARAGFARLGAATDLARVGTLAEIASAVTPHGLTRRELEVLRRISAGRSNKAIAAELVLSVRTVDRHVSNIYAKLGVSSRAAATSFAHEHQLI
jgi:DNA-binding NarL/FixJ family response regulator